MSVYSIPSFIMVVATFIIGLYHLLLYFRRYKLYHEDLTFAICCFAMSLYGVYCVGMYNADSLREGLPFQRGQVASLTLIGTTFLWFVVDYLNVQDKIIERFVSSFFIISAIFVLLNRSSVTFYMDRPAIKQIMLPFNRQIIYYEVQPGPYVEFLSLMGMMVFLYVFYVAIREFRFGDKRKAKSMIGAVIIFCVALVNDASVHIGFYQFFYVIEYGYMGIVLLMAVSLTNEVVESALRKEALEESEKKYRELIDNSLVGIFITQDHFIRFCNDRFAEIFGYKQSNEIVGKSWSQFLIPEEKAFIIGEMSQDQTEESDSKQLEFRGVQKNGRIIDIQSFFGYILLNKAPALQGTIIDITGRKSAERKLKQSSDELKHYTLELEQFVSVTSHQLQEPLRSIGSYVQLLAKRYHDQLDQNAHEYIQFAVEGVNHMYHLINDFLVYMRVDKPWQAIHPVSLVTVVKRVIGHLNETISQNQAEITADSLPTVIGEESKLELLFKNLLLNAISYKCSDPPRIYIFAEQENNKWRIGVRDNGIGIPPEYHRLIFGMFEKLDNKTKETGTGIGLPICKKIVEQHHGEIWVESDIEKGATFYFTLENGDVHSSDAFSSI